MVSTGRHLQAFQWWCRIYLWGPWWAQSRLQIDEDELLCDTCSGFQWFESVKPLYFHCKMYVSHVFRTPLMLLCLKNHQIFQLVKTKWLSCLISLWCLVLSFSSSCLHWNLECIHINQLLLTDCCVMVFVWLAVHKTTLRLDFIIWWFTECAETKTGQKNRNKLTF